jgi:hypothetical protein
LPVFSVVRPGISRAFLVPGENILEEGPLLRLIVRLEGARIEEQEQDAVLRAVDQLARVIQILALIGRREPLRDRAAVEIEGL